MCVNDLTAYLIVLTEEKFRMKRFGHGFFKIYFDIIADLKVARIVKEFPCSLCPDSLNVNILSHVLYSSSLIHFCLDYLKISCRHNAPLLLNTQVFIL